MTKTLFTNFFIIDSTGGEPFTGEVLVVDDRITEIARGTDQLPREGT